jgi:hypothetical protein
LTNSTKYGIINTERNEREETIMITAREAREIQAKAVEDKIKRLRETAEKFCENLSEKIVSNSKMEFSNIIVEVPTNTKREYVMSILRDNGYTVAVLGDGRLNIAW